jgi:predicted CXXCH cytochrome family protein
VDVQGAAVVHRPLATGECMVCHDPHGGGDRYLLKAASASELCQNCHADVIRGKPEVHGPVAAGACGACHSPHTSQHPKLLAAEGVALCLQCHVSTQEQLAKMRVVHGPVATDCMACHEAHSADHKMILKKEPQALCAGCHEEISAVIAGAKTQHSAVTTERACLNCHDAHASDYPRMVRTRMVDLCFECHDREIEMPDGHKLGNIKAVIAAGTSLHGPVAQDNCAACHLIHGGDNFRLLIEEYPPEFYAPFKEESYALCFNCHDRQLVHDEKTSTLTNFRNGDQNLHYLHVNRKTKGRTCRACHETHASTREKHIRESVPFGTGGWLLPVNFKKQTQGGSCAPGCHMPYEYNRETPVTYPRAKPPAVWQEQPAPTPPPAVQKPIPPVPAKGETP